MMTPTKTWGSLTIQIDVPIYNKIGIKANDFTNPCDRYIEINIKLSNSSGKDTIFPFLPLILNVTDWFAEYSDEETGFTDNDADFYKEYGRIIGINIHSDETVNINLVYGLCTEMLILISNKTIDKFDDYNSISLRQLILPCASTPAISFLINEILSVAFIHPFIGY